VTSILQSAFGGADARYVPSINPSIGQKLVHSTIRHGQLPFILNIYAGWRAFQDAIFFGRQKIHRTVKTDFAFKTAGNDLIAFVRRP
jgi:hypothetical protein